MEREHNSRDWSHDLRDLERAQRRPSREFRPLEGDKREEREWEQSPVDSPILQEHDRRSPPAETEESTGEGSASTGDFCERDDPATLITGREEAAQSLALAKAEALAPPPSPLSSPTEMAGGGRGHPLAPTSSHAPQKEGEAQSVWLPKKPRRRKKGRRDSRKAEPEGQVTIPPAEIEDYRRMKNFPLRPRPFHNTRYTSHEMRTNT